MNFRQWVRHHPGLFVAFLALAVSIGANIVLWTILGRLRSHVERQRERLANMQRLADEYAAVKARSSARAIASGPGVLRATAVERIAQEHGVKVVGMTFVPPVKVDDRVQEQVLSLSLPGVALPALRGFLRGVEGLDPAVRTRELRVGKNLRDGTLIDATVKFAVYETVAPEAR